MNKTSLAHLLTRVMPLLSGLTLLSLVLALGWGPDSLALPAAQARTGQLERPRVTAEVWPPVAIAANQALTQTRVSTNPAPAPVITPAAPPGLRKVIAPAGVLDPARDGVSLWHDYGAFALYRMTGAQLTALRQTKGEQLSPADWMDTIQLGNYPLNTRAVDLSPLPPALQMLDPVGPALHLIQFVGPLKAAWLQAVEVSGGRPIHYIANNAYLVWADTGSRPRLQALAQAGDFVQFSLPYQPYFKLGPTLLTRVTRPQDPAEVIPAVIQLYNHAGVADTEAFIQQRAVAFLAPAQPILNYKNLHVEIRAADIVELAHRPDVVWLGEWFEPELFDEVQGQLMAGNLAGSQGGPAGPGYQAWLDSFGFSANPADYPIIDITDDGIGGNTAPTVPNKLTNDPTLDPRVVFRISCNAPNPNDGRGPDGHGHINASIAVGNDTRTGAPYQDAAGFNLGLGINPYGRVGGTRIFGGGFDISLCDGAYTGLIAASFAQGARISSNSWGCGIFCGGASIYNDSSQAYDVGTRDADLGTTGNQELITIFAAGNDGSFGTGTIGSPGNGKNMITVGAAESYRPFDVDGCGTDATGADHAMDLINFSSRGPAPGGRVKPELVAPGTHIQGTASTHPNFNASGVCGAASNDGFEPPDEAYYPPGQTTFTWSSGTSHSAPAVAGLASLYYYWLQQTAGITASPALMKAYLLAHTSYLTGTGANDTLPSNNQGYGRPTMNLGFDNTPRYLLNQSVIFDNSGQTWTWQGAVTDPAKPVRIVLAYTDQAGVIGTSPQVNDLNLAAVVDGVTYLGNRFSGPWSATGGSPDPANNYEAIFLPPGTTGAISMTITAFNIAGDGLPNIGDLTDQDFALVCYNCADSPDFTLQALPATQAICAPAPASYNLTLAPILDFAGPVTLSVSGHPTGTTSSFSANPVSPPGASLLTIGNTGVATPGSYNIAITGAAPTRTHTSTVRLDLFNSLPGAVSLTAPANGATNVSLNPSLTWVAATQAVSYHLEVATDMAFSNIVYSATVLSNDHILTTSLNSNTIYYWRVRAANTCGAGGYSATFSFITLPLPGQCSLGTTSNLIFSDNFETGAPGWTHSGNSDTWALWGTRVRSGTQAWHANNLNSVSDQQLVSPPISLPADQSPLTLQFWNYQAIEATTATSCFDGAILEISTDNGNNWTQVANPSLLTDPYNGPVDLTFGNPLGGLNAWCGDPQDWLNSVVDLAAYAGQTVNFRFRLGTDSLIDREGWTIDDIVVQSCQPLPADLAITKTVMPNPVVPGSPVTYTLTFSNAGAGLATGVAVTDVLPMTLTQVSYSQSGVAVTQTNVGVLSYTWQVQDLIPAQVGIITIGGVVSPGLTTDTRFTNTTQLMATNGDSNPTDNSAEAELVVTLPRLAFSRPAYQVVESNGPAIITLTAQPTPLTTATVVMTTSDGTASSGTSSSFELELEKDSFSNSKLQLPTDPDYTAISRTLIFSPGRSSLTITLAITADSLAEPAETVNLALSHPQGAALGLTRTAVLTISEERVPGPAYLPLVMKRSGPTAPDLIVDSLMASSSAVTVVIKNIGDAPVGDAFWVDVYLNPDPPPSGVNQIWQNLSSQGLAWGVTTPIPANGGMLTLTIGDAYYVAAESNFAGLLAPGTPVYAQVDSVNLDTTYGGVLESHEIAGGAYNNIQGPVLSTAGVLPEPTPAEGAGPPLSPVENLPPR